MIKLYKSIKNWVYVALLCTYACIHPTQNSTSSTSASWKPKISLACDITLIAASIGAFLTGLYLSLDNLYGNPNHTRRGYFIEAEENAALFVSAAALLCYVAKQFIYPEYFIFKPSITISYPQGKTS